MTDNVSVPRDLLERIVGKCKLSVLGDDHAKVWELLEAPAVDVEGLEVICFHCMDSAGIETLDWRGGSYADEPLCSLPKAQAVIDKQAARIKELEKDAAIGEVVWRFIDRMGDHCEVDKAETILDQFVAAVTPHIMAALKGETP